MKINSTPRRASAKLFNCQRRLNRSAKSLRRAIRRLDRLFNTIKLNDDNLLKPLPIFRSPKNLVDVRQNFKDVDSSSLSLKELELCVGISFEISRRPQTKTA